MRSPPAAALVQGRIAVVLVSLLVSAAATAADPAPPPPPVTLYDIVGELARTDSLKRDIAATLRDTSDVTALTATPDARVLAPEFRALVERTDAVTRVRYLELLALDVHIRQRAHDLNASTAALGRLTQKLVADLDRPDRQAAAWPERAKLARARESPAEVQRGIEAVGPELAALRAPLLERRDQFLVAYDRAVRNQSQLEALLARVVERREAIR